MAIPVLKKRWQKVYMCLQDSYTPVGWQKKRGLSYVLHHTLYYGVVLMHLNG